MIFSCLEKSLSKKGLIKIVNVIKQEVRMEESLRKRLEFICEFCRVKPIIINGNLSEIILELGDKEYWDTKDEDFKKILKSIKNKLMI